MTIAILDYEMGNLKSVSKALETVGAEVRITRDPKEALKADKLIVPGVGAFRDCMVALEKFKLDEAIRSFIDSGRPYLGICLGMQVLMDESEEGGKFKGLGIFPGKVIRFSPKFKLKVPHMGWNRLDPEKKCRILDGLAPESFAYFVHSYYVTPKAKKICGAKTEYGEKFTSVIEQDNVFGVQFHPEKSQAVGLKILENFVKRI
jgi:glutamine amidotransferase